MLFADIHNHSLASVDDGATSEETMYRMLDAAYAEFSGQTRSAPPDTAPKTEGYSPEQLEAVLKVYQIINERAD